MTLKKATKKDFVKLNAALTDDVVRRIEAAGRKSAVIAEAPPGAGKSTLTATVANALVKKDKTLRVAIVTQTNEQADDLVLAIARRFAQISVARMIGSSGASASVRGLAGATSMVCIGGNGDDPAVRAAKVVVSTARKWQYERSRLQQVGRDSCHRIALIDEAYQMRSDMLLGISHLFDTLFCVGDPGQLDPFTVIDDSMWRGLPYSPSRAALAVLRTFHDDIQPILLPTSWRLPPSAARVVSEAFYPFNGFEAGTCETDRVLSLGKAKSRVRQRGNLGQQPSIDFDAVLAHASTTGWGYVELPERFTPRTDLEVAGVLASLVERLWKRGATVVDERAKERPLGLDRVAVIAAHNDQVHAVRYALSQVGVNCDDLTVSTANKIQGREYDFVFVWHPLSGRRDATAFHLEAGRMCVMLSRHRHACVVVGRAGATRLLEEFPDADPVYIGEPEKFPDGWEANHKVLLHLEGHRVG